MMETRGDTPVTLHLAKIGTPFRLFRHSGPIHSLEQAAHERSQRPEQVVRSIVFRLEEGHYLMVLVAGPRQISWPTLRQYLGVSRVTMASEAEVLESTGYPLGAVSPFGLPSPMRLLVDESVFDEEEISLGSGVRGVAVILKTTDFRQALGEVEIVNLVNS